MPSDESEAKTQDKEVEEKCLEDDVRQLESKQRRWLSIGLPILLAVLFLEAVLLETAFSRLWQSSSDPGPLLRLLLEESWQPYGLTPVGTDIVTSAVRFIPFWILTLGIAASSYFFAVLTPLRATTQRLRDLREWNHLDELNQDPEELRKYVNRKVLSLSHEMAQTFLNNAMRYEDARLWRDDVLKLLNQTGNGNNYDKLVEAHALVSRIYELKAQEEGELREQAKWRRYATVILFIYVALIIAISFAFAGHPEGEVPVFAVPVSVALWAAAGSLAAIGYRLYTEKERVRLDLEIRWLIARPVIGIIMGMLAFLAIRAGLLLLNKNATPLNGAADTMAVYWVVAFMAGFSDKFYHRIIDLLVQRTVGDTDADEESATTRTSPDVMTPEQQYQIALKWMERGAKDSLKGFDLRGSDLQSASLPKADLRRAGLSGTKLGIADLRGADLRMADLSGADLNHATLGETNLRRANLRGANLTGADLTLAGLYDSDLSGANLSGATVTDEQLAQAKSLEGATLPDGTVHK